MESPSEVIFKKCIVIGAGISGLAVILTLKIRFILFQNNW